MWRNVSFVERVEVDFHGNVNNQALVLGDVDNDQGMELVAGSIDGDLAIFKGRGSHPWRKASDLRMITCLGIGDVCNRKKNNLMCLTAEGWCYIFDIKSDSSSDGPESQKEAEEIVESDSHLRPAFTQHLPANCKVMLIADIDGDGQVEVVVGYSDRNVRSFRWQGVADGEPYNYSAGSLRQLQQWQLEAQIGSITLRQGANGFPELMASQPGGTYVVLCVRSPSPLPSAQDAAPQDSSVEDILYHPLGSKRSRNRDVSTVILAGISRSNTTDEDASQTDSAQTGSYFALATLDGTLMLVDGDKIIWSLQVDHQLFSLSKLDVTGNGKEEVVCCSWDGHTYIVNHSREVVRYNFGESVAVFAAGYFALDEGKNTPCFVYATFKNKIYIYHNISLARVESISLMEVMNRAEETAVLLAKLNVNPAKKDQVRELYQWCLYGQHETS